MGLKSFLQGYKTYLLAILGGIIAGAQYLQGNTTNAELFALIAAIAATLHDAIEHSKATTTQ